MQPKSKYASYLLRLWQMQNDEQVSWVASIQSPATGEQRWFSSVDALVKFFQSEFGDCTSPDSADPSAADSAE